MRVVSVRFICVRFFIRANLFFFYFFFESSLIPILFLILGWGYQPERLQAGYYMIIYTVRSSMPLFMIICLVWGIIGTDRMVEISISNLIIQRRFVWFILILGFLVKIPVFLVHNWLPKAHVEAPVRGSIILAGVLLKLGGYGIYRFFLSFNFFSRLLRDLILVRRLWGGLLCRVICFCQRDIKSLIAYSSIGHIRLVLGGVISLFCLGWMGGVCIIFAHGLCSPCIFSLGNLTYSLYSSRRIVICKGLLKFFPIIALFWFVFRVLNIGCPPSLNFLREVFLICRILSISWIFSLLLGLICFVAAGYCLFLYRRVNHGGTGGGIKARRFCGERSLISVMVCGVLLFSIFINIDLTFV